MTAPDVSVDNDTNKPPLKRAGQSGLLPRSNSTASSSTASTSANSSLRKRPRISRSRVIAKLGEKRAAEDAAALGPMTPGQALRAKAKTRSSVGVSLREGSAIATRRSFATGSSAAITGSPVGLARKEKAAMESFQRGQRKSEAAAKRRSSRAQVQASVTIAEQKEDMSF